MSFYFEYLAREKYADTNFGFVGGCLASFLNNAGIPSIFTADVACDSICLETTTPPHGPKISAPQHRDNFPMLNFVHSNPNFSIAELNSNPNFPLCLRAGRCFIVHPAPQGKPNSFTHRTSNAPALFHVLLSHTARSTEV
jgi:hypothetical protein